MVWGYQDDLIIPGISPLDANSRKQMRQMSKSRIYPCFRPHRQQRRTILVEYFGLVLDLLVKRAFLIRDDLVELLGDDLRALRLREIRVGFGDGGGDLVTDIGVDGIGCPLGRDGQINRLDARVVRDVHGDEKKEE